MKFFTLPWFTVWTNRYKYRITLFILYKPVHSKTMVS